METAGWGKHVFPAITVSEGIAIGKELERLEQDTKLGDRLREVKHGHDFWYDRKCWCGMCEREYYSGGREQGTCPEVGPEWFREFFEGSGKEDEPRKEANI